MNCSYIYHTIGEIMMQLCVHSTSPVRHGTSPVSPVEYLLLILIERIGQHYSTVSWVPRVEIHADSVVAKGDTYHLYVIIDNIQPHGYGITDT